MKVECISFKIDMGLTIPEVKALGYNACQNIPVGAEILSIKEGLLDMDDYRKNMMTVIIEYLTYKL